MYHRSVSLRTKQTSFPLSVRFYGHAKSISLIRTTLLADAIKNAEESKHIVRIKLEHAQKEVWSVSIPRIKLLSQFLYGNLVE